ncbi:hypothetical protein EDD15DRAFT_2200208 [Pisolithus albus]|nr:hypothetical protein EDD15DRAFT_2200208 [Pisolithus albus]
MKQAMQGLNVHGVGQLEPQLRGHLLYSDSFAEHCLPRGDVLSDGSPRDSRNSGCCGVDHWHLRLFDRLVTPISAGVSACDRPSVVPFLSQKAEKIKPTFRELYAGGNSHFRAYKDALQHCHCAALPGIMLFIGGVARGCGSGPYEAHPLVPGSLLINSGRYRRITNSHRRWRDVMYLSKSTASIMSATGLSVFSPPFREGTEIEWENRIHAKCHYLQSRRT